MIQKKQLIPVLSSCGSNRFPESKNRRFFLLSLSSLVFVEKPELLNPFTGMHSLLDILLYPGTISTYFIFFVLDTPRSLINSVACNLHLDN